MALQDFFGSSTTHPPTVEAYAPYGPEGLIWFANNLMRVMIYGSLLIALINIVVSGIQYIGSSGNPEILKAASSRIWISVLGLIVAGGSLVVAGVLGLIFFGNATAIISPTIYGP
jgi:magnesium-transporting ATPase (P-type)